MLILFILYDVSSILEMLLYEKKREIDSAQKMQSPEKDNTAIDNVFIEDQTMPSDAPSTAERPGFKKAAVQAVQNSAKRIMSGMRGAATTIRGAARMSSDTPSLVKWSTRLWRLEAFVVAALMILYSLEYLYMVGANEEYTPMSLEMDWEKRPKTGM